MYHLSPYTYVIGGLLSNALHGVEIVCKSNEINVFQPPSGQSCTAYAGPFVSSSPGKLLNPDAMQNCQYCRYATGDQWLASFDLSWDQRWRNFGFLWAYVLFNVVVLFLLFFCFRIWKYTYKSKRGVEKSSSMIDQKDVVISTSIQDEQDSVEEAVTAKQHGV